MVPWTTTDTERTRGRGHARRVVVFKEPIGTMKFTSLTLIVLGVVGLNLSGR